MGAIYLLEWAIRHTNSQNIGRFVVIIGNLWVIIKCEMTSSMIFCITYM